MAKWGEVKFSMCAALEERLEAAQRDAKEAEAYAEELEAKLAQQNDLVQAANRLAEYLNGNPIYMERVHHLAALVRKGGE